MHALVLPPNYAFPGCSLKQHIIVTYVMNIQGPLNGYVPIDMDQINLFVGTSGLCIYEQYTNRQDVAPACWCNIPAMSGRLIMYKDVFLEAQQNTM